VRSLKSLRSKVRCPTCDGKVTIKTNMGCGRCKGKPLFGIICKGCGLRKFYRMNVEEFLMEVTHGERTED